MNKIIKIFENSFLLQFAAAVTLCLGGLTVEVWFFLMGRFQS